MGAENDKVKLQQSKENNKFQQNINIKEIVSRIFSVEPSIKISEEDKDKMDNILKTSDLNFSAKQIELFLKQVKKIVGINKNNPTTELNNLINLYRKKWAEKKDIQNNPKLVATSDQLQIRRAEREKERLRNQNNNSLNEKTRAQEEETKKLLETEKKWLKDIKIEGEKRLETIRATKESYQKLSPDLKQHSPEEINTKINALSPHTKARLKKSGLSLSDYAQFSLAREKIASLDTKTPEGETFLTTLKKMEK